MTRGLLNFLMTLALALCAARVLMWLGADLMRGRYADGFLPRRVILIPFWFAVAFIGFLLVYRLLSFAQRTPRYGPCPRCGYDLTGNTSGVCPECGGAITETR